MPYFNEVFINVTRNPIVESPYFADFGDGTGGIPTGEVMILENGDYMITETTSDNMITE